MQFWKFFHSLALAGTLCVIGLSAYAQPDVRPGCDPQVMDAIEAKSWLHAQRRVVQNKNLIQKPDSVLEYSCFNQLLGYIAANEGGRRFSEHHPPYPLWETAGGIAGINETSLDNALFNVVTEPMIAYLSDNFGHTFLGGRLEDAGGSAPVNGEVNCTAMSYVWHAARCSNFVEDNQTPEGEERYVLGDDDFYDFPWYQANDPRRIPTEFQCEVDGRIQNAIIESYRGRDPNAPGSTHGDEHPTFTLAEENNPYLDDGELYEEDPIIVTEILDMILPGDCGDSAVVPTGLTVAIPDEDEYPEHVCAMPSCSYNGEECVQ